MMNSKIISIQIIIFLWAGVIVSVESASKKQWETNRGCVSSRCEYKECKVPNKGRKITSITMHNPPLNGECDFHPGVISTSWSCDQGPVYGFVDDKIVVAGGCKGVFTVSYTAGLDIATPDDYSYHVIDVDVSEHTSLIFKVAACNDAHILLMKDKDAETSNIYELVLGGWRNSKSVIRDEKQGDPLTLEYHHPLHCAIQRLFWISWEDGLIRVGEDGVVGENEFMRYNDPSPIDVNYIAISTGWGASGQWTFDDNECINPICFNGGTCTNLLFNGYQCQCPVGYEGQNCEKAVDKITYGPCVDEESCRRYVVGFKCDCGPIYASKEDESDVTSKKYRRSLSSEDRRIDLRFGGK